MTRFEYRLTVRKDEKKANGDVIALDRVLDDSKVAQGVTISFKRTIRVPDNSGISQLPPALGSFPLHKVSEHRSRLPGEIVHKGGVFLPMHEKEAMWICFASTAPFMIKIYAGGVNVVSGEHSEESAATQARRIDLQREGRAIQDYVVVPDQRWIDGIAVRPGVVRQFVAMPLGQGYTVEAQLTGNEAKGGLQLEITPSKEPVKDLWRAPQATGGPYLYVKMLTGNCLTIPYNASDTMDDLKNHIQELAGFPPDLQRLIFDGKQLEDGRTVADYYIPKGATIHHVSRLRGGGPMPPQAGHDLGVAAGGRIKQNICKDFHKAEKWIRDLTFTIPVHMLTPQMFEKATGTEAPTCPIDAQAYANAGLPFFSLFEKTPSNISGAKSFASVKSVNEVEAARGFATGQEPMVVPRTVELNEQSLGMKIWSDGDVFDVNDPDGLLSPDGPRREVRTLADLEEELKRLKLG